MLSRPLGFRSLAIRFQTSLRVSMGVCTESIPSRATPRKMKGITDVGIDVPPVSKGHRFPALVVRPRSQLQLPLLIHESLSLFGGHVRQEYVLHQTIISFANY